MLGLQTAIEAAVEAHRPAGRVAVSVLDLQTGEHIGFNTDRQQLSGCVINLFVIMRAVLDVQEGRIPLSQVDSLIRRTTWSSNPVTARELYRIVGDGNVITGLERVERLIHDELGLREIVLNHPPGYAWSSDRLGRNSDNWITAATMNEALAAIVRGDLFDNAHRAYLLEVLGQVTPGLNYLTAAVPGAASVSHKNGFLWSTAGYVDNDAGIVRFQRGGQTYAYAITMLFEGYPAKHGNIPLGQRISSEVWSHFSATYR